MLATIKPRKPAQRPVLPQATARALSRLVKDLKSDDHNLRAATLYRVRHFALPEVVDLISSRLRRELTSRNDNVRAKAAETLLLLGPQGFCADSQPRSAGLLLLMQSVRVEQRLDAVRYIRQALDHAQRRPGLLSGLVSEMIPALLMALNDPDAEVRQEAGNVVRQLGADAEPLIDVLWLQLQKQGEDLPRHLVLPRLVLGPKRPEEQSYQQGCKP